MGHARRSLSLALVVLVASCIALLGGGCGSSGEGSGSGPSADQGSATSRGPAGATAQGCEVAMTGIGQLRVTGVNCVAGRAVTAAWSGKGACAAASGSSRSSCEVKGYRCIGATSSRGLSVSCASPGRSIAFLAAPGQSDAGR